MSKKAERVVVIQDASKEPSLSTIQWPLVSLSLKSGDKLIVLGIINQVNNNNNNPSALSFMGAGKFMGFRTKMDAGSMSGTNKKREEYQTNPEMVKISEECGKKQIEFQIKMIADSSLKAAAIRYVRKFHATWLVLDRDMKNDQRSFVENLCCNIVRMKKDNKIEELRVPKTSDDHKEPAPRRSSITYDEMIPAISPSAAQFRRKSSRGSREHPRHSSRKSTSHSAPTSGLTSDGASTLGNELKSSLSHCHDEEYTATTGPETGGEHSPVSINESGDQKDLNSPDDHIKQHNHNDDWMGGNTGDQVFRNTICSICKNRRPKIGWTGDFSYADLQAATEGFNATNFLSEGGFGSVYRGEINGMKIAVKQHKYNASFQGEKEFKSEVQVLRKARHENLVMLVGSCSEGNHRLLVYEFVCNGSLDIHLSKHARRPLNWEKRVKIALGAARGLKYLHDNNIIHRDMRPNNILVTHEFEALLGDFGLARTQREDPDQSSETITRVVGTLGYLAPEYAECGKASFKTDVYAFGVVLLQLITGMKTNDKRLGAKSLVGWARPLLEERNYPDLIDPRILDSHDVHQLFWMVRVTERCLCKDPKKRLTMEQVGFRTSLQLKVVQYLEYIVDCDFCDNISSTKDLSPAQSDAVSRDSCETPSHSPYEEDADNNSSLKMETTSISSPSQFGGRTSPSSSISRKSSASTLYGESTASGSGSSGHERYL